MSVKVVVAVDIEGIAGVVLPEHTMRHAVRVE